MNKKLDLSVPGNRAHRQRGINRRELVRQLLMAGGAGFSLPGIAQGHPVTKHLASRGKTAEAGVAKSNWLPTFLDHHQIETLTVLGERIIPGSAEAQVSQFIDLLLSVDTQDAQKKLLASLSAFEAESLRRFSHPYKDLPETKQNKILTAASTEKHGEASEGMPPRFTMRDHFENIKGWVASAYYSSEVGMKEMGWIGQVYFSSFPGCRKFREHH